VFRRGLETPACTPQRGTEALVTNLHRCALNYVKSLLRRDLGRVPLIPRGLPTRPRFAEREAWSANCSKDQPKRSQCATARKTDAPAVAHRTDSSGGLAHRRHVEIRDAHRRHRGPREVLA